MCKTITPCSIIVSTLLRHNENGTKLSSLLSFLVSLPVFPVFPSPVRRRMVRNLTLRLQPAVCIARPGPNHRCLLYGRPALGLPPLYFPPLSFRLYQLIPVSSVLVVVARRRLPAPVPVLPVWLARPARLFALVIRRPSIVTVSMPVPHTSNVQLLLL